MTRKRLFGFMTSLALAIAGTAVLAAYVNSAEDRALAGEEIVEVLVIDKLIKAGATAEEVAAASRIERVPTKVRADTAVATVDGLSGQVSAVDLLPGEQILTNRFVTAAAFEEAESTLTAIPPGYHEITIALEAQRAVGGELRPGDSVGVISSFDAMPTNGSAAVRWVDANRLREALELGVDLNTIAAWFGTEAADEATEGPEEEDGTGFTDQVIVDDQEAFLQAAELVISLNGDLPFDARQTPAVTHLLVHKVLVTRVQHEEVPEVDEDEERNTDLAPSGRLLVTLAVPVEDIESVVFSAEFGRIWLSAEPDEAPESGTRVVNRENVYEQDADDSFTPAEDESVSFSAQTREAVGE